MCGQTRAEHIEYVAQRQRQIRAADRHARSIQVEGKVSPHQMSLPYFPYLASWDGDDLLEHALSMAAIGKESQLYAHEMCALEMFRARLGTFRHAARRGEGG